MGAVVSDQRAHSAVAYAVEKGTLIRPAACSTCCQAAFTVAHHDDYNKPLSVRWLCRSCHRKWHHRNQAIAHVEPATGNTASVSFTVSPETRASIEALAESMSGRSLVAVTKTDVLRLVTEEGLRSLWERERAIQSAVGGAR